MNLSNLTGGLGNIKDELTGEARNLGEEVIEGKTSPTDALHEGEEKVMDSFKGFFGSGEHKDASDETSDDDSKTEEPADDSDSTSDDDAADDSEEK